MSEVKWEVKKLGEVCEIIAGQSPQSKYYNDEGKGLPFYQGKKEFSKKYIGYPTTWTSFITKEALADDILLSVRAPVGPVNFATETICIGRGLSAIRAGASINKEYLFYFLLKHEKEIETNAASGAVFKSLNQTQIRNIQIPLPPLPEQQRIVSLLDKAFESIDQAKANAEKNLENAKALFESYLQSVFKTKGEGWEEKKLEGIVELMYGFTEKSKSEGDYRYIRITDIDSEGLLCPNRKVYVDKSEAHKSYILKNNDLVMARTGASFGDVLLYKDIEPSIFASYLIRITFKEQIDNKLYWYFAKSPLYWNQARSLATGAAQPQFNGNAVKQVVFRYPKSINRQQEIIRQLDNLSDEIKQIEINYQARLDELEELRKSILEKAFKGKL